MWEKEIDVVEFAQEVEDLCNFILDKVKGIPPREKIMIMKLKEKSADLQFSYVDGG